MRNRQPAGVRRRALQDHSHRIDPDGEYEVHQLATTTRTNLCGERERKRALLELPLSGRPVDQRCRKEECMLDLPTWVDNAEFEVRNVGERTSGQGDAYPPRAGVEWKRQS